MKTRSNQFLSTTAFVLSATCCAVLHASAEGLLDTNEVDIYSTDRAMRCIQAGVPTVVSPAQVGLDVISMHVEDAQEQADVANSCTLVLQAGSGTAGVVTLRNNSTRVTARDIRATLPASWTDVAQNASNCASVPPGATCTLRFTPGSTSHAAATIPIQGTNTTRTLMTMSVSPLFLGQAVGGGIVACLGGGQNNLIISVPEFGDLTWANGNNVTFYGVTSFTNGAANTTTLVGAIGAGNTYPAGLCSGYQVDSAGNSPCVGGNTCYSDWFLPASDQLNCVYQNRVATGLVFNNRQWSSTEDSASDAWDQIFLFGGARAPADKNILHFFRCARVV